MPSQCYFCSERVRPSYFSYFCDDCAMLRRMLMIYSPDKCTEILKRTCLRDDKQIDFKIGQEIKKIVNNDIIASGIEKMPTIHEEKPVTPQGAHIISTRSKKL
jgi:hypothetical protein